MEADVTVIRELVSIHVTVSFLYNVRVRDERRRKKGGRREGKVYKPSSLEHVTVVTFCYITHDGTLLVKTPPLTIVNPQSTVDFRPRLLSSTHQTSDPIPINVFSECLVRGREERR